MMLKASLRILTKNFSQTEILQNAIKELVALKVTCTDSGL